MQGGETARSGGRARAVAIAAVALIAFAGAVEPAAPAKKKKKKQAPATTVTATTPLASGATATATAGCVGKRHATGGGFAVSPSYAPNPNTPGGTGLRSMTLTSVPSGDKGWTASGSAFTNPAASGTFSAFARCESNALGRIVVRAASTATLGPAAGQTFVFNCPPSTHVISGGYSGDAPSALNSDDGWKVVVLQSYRTGKGQWTISAYNRAPPPTNTPATVTGWAVCEQDGKGKGVSEASATVGVPENGRAAVDASCPGKKHSVSGGFRLLPASFPGQVPVAGVDENQPVGKKTWRVGLHEWQKNDTPPGTSLTTYAYCKKDALPKKRKK